MSDAKRILIVDDDTDHLEQVSLILRNAGYEVCVAQSRQEGEEQMLAKAPDLAILDIMMEEKDAGFVLAHYIKKLYPDTPVILLSAVRATTGLDISTRAMDAESWIKADAILDKPIRPDQLKTEIQRLLSTPAKAN
ncbi:MAG: response regulator [bacterium]